MLFHFYQLLFKSVRITFDNVKNTTHVHALAIDDYIPLHNSKHEMLQCLCDARHNYTNEHPYNCFTINTNCLDIDLLNDIYSNIIEFDIINSISIKNLPQINQTYVLNVANVTNWNKLT